MNGAVVQNTPQEAAARLATTTIVFVRHAEVHNPCQVFYGRLPGFSLSERGRGQAADVAAVLAAPPVATIYTSPLLRARQTAEAIAAHHPAARLRRSALLLEVGSGAHGLPYAGLPAGFPTYEEPLGPHDEAIHDILRRMLAAVAMVRRRHAGGRVVCVSHGDPITILRLALQVRALTLPALRGPDYAEQCSMTELTYGLHDRQPSVRYVDPP